jgi:hypothetical protein
MNDTNDNSPDLNASEAPAKPKPPLPPPPGQAPPPPPARAPLPAYEAVPRPPKSPPLAAFLSLVPGIGHLYSWAYERAFMIWATIAVCIFLIVQTDFPALLLFAFTILFTYFFSIFDAYREAQLFNLRAEDQSIPKPRSDSQGRLMFGVFLAVIATVVLVDKLHIFNTALIYEWWPVPVLALGIYLIYAAVRDRGKERQEGAGADESEGI